MRETHQDDSDTVRSHIALPPPTGAAHTGQQCTSKLPPNACVGSGTGAIFHYIDGAADDEVTYRRNTEAYERCDLVRLF
jgi:hypothetical protein